MMASTTAADDVHGPGVGKKDTAGGGAPGAVRPPEQGLKCPRCDSPNTKFCYYNNYSLAQPRYFCKTCRRYWTKGGALRNVPVGGGCRKSKKSKASSSTAPSAAASSHLSSSEVPAQELRLYQLGLPTAVDFHLGGGGGLPFSRLHHPSAVPGVFGTAAADGAAASHLISFGDLSCSAAALPAEAAGATAAPLIGFSYPIQALAPPPFADVGIGGGGDASTSGSTMSSMHSNLAASIESLSSINQGLHWKLQQQRLATFFGGDPSQQQHRGKGGSCDAAATATLPMSLLEGPSRPTSCQMPASSKDICLTGAASAGGVSRKGSMVGDASSSAAEWFLDNPTTYTTPHAHGSLNSSGSATSNNWSGVQTWSDMHQFSALP